MGRARRKSTAVIGVGTSGQPRPDLRWYSGEQLSDLVCSAPLIVFALDLDGTIRVSTGGALAGVGIEPGEMVGANIFDAVPEGLPFADHCRRALDGERFEEITEFADRFYETRYCPVFSPCGERIGAYGLGVDITERIEMQRSLHDFAAVDAVTELSSRQAIEAEVSQQLAGGGMPTLLLIDLDEFKDINDTHGHVLGDLVLRELGRRLRRIVPEDAVVGRMGGDELLVVLAGADADEIVHLAERIQSAIARPLRIDLPVDSPDEPVEVAITASIGIVCAPQDGDSAAQLLARADAAMYVAKRSGGATYRFYDRRADDAPRRLTVATRLRRAVARHEVHPVFQPLYRLADNSIAGFESLARWHDPELGQVPPAEFIALAERSPLIDQLFDSMLHQTLVAAAGWDTGLGINITARQLRDGQLADRLAKAAERSGFPLRQICIELTETAMMDDLDTTRRTLAALSESGVEIYIDDFGVGYSNVARLADLATAGILNGIKVDRRFLADSSRPRMIALLQLFRHMSETFGVNTVLEGIETAEHLRIARELGYRLGQGWYLGRPVPAEAAGILLRAAGPPS